MSVKTVSELATLARGAGFPESQIPVAVAVALAESGGRTDATHRNGNGSTDYGLWQINSGAHPDLLKKYQWSNPQENAAMAYSVWKAAGGKWTPWATYNHGSYQKFLNKTQGVAVNNSADALGTAGASPATPTATMIDPSFINVTTQLGSVNFWKRIGIGALAVLLILIGVLIIFRQPIAYVGKKAVSLATTAATKGAVNLPSE